MLDQRGGALGYGLPGGVIIEGEAVADQASSSKLKGAGARIAG